MIKNRYSSAITDKPWWLAGGIPAANCLAAYQPVGAASLASSYINLANPGTYNAAPGKAPNFATSTGWGFVSANQLWLDTGVLPLANMSAFIRYSGVNSAIAPGILSYSGNDSTRFGVMLRYNTVCTYQHAHLLDIAGGAKTAGVTGVAGQQGYHNGVAEGGTIPGTWSGPATTTIGIGKENGWTEYATVDVQAVVIYNTNITADQVAALTIAMNAL